MTWPMTDSQDFAAGVRDPDERPGDDDDSEQQDSGTSSNGHEADPPEPVAPSQPTRVQRSKADVVKLFYECDLTEDGLADAFRTQYEGRLLYDHHAGSWYIWHKGAWRKEETKLAFTWARQTCRDLALLNAVDTKLKAILARASTAAAIVRFAQADRAFAVTSEIWDRNPFLLGTPEGTVDLRIWPYPPS
jgi:phage/plasmid-associated DNA primase